LLFLKKKQKNSKKRDAARVFLLLPRPSGHHNTRLMQIKFCGAAREVTGSSHLLTLDSGYKILLDCGLYQGHDDAMENFNETWLFDPTTIDCLVVSHAHIDHTGRIPRLVRDGFRGRIIATHATRDLCALMLLDSAKIQESDAAYHNKKKALDAPAKSPLYTIKDVQQVLQQFVGYGYEQWAEVSPEVRVLFRDAGHILGSASVTLEIREGDRTRRIGFTGDVGRPARPILGDPEPLPEVEFLICESTYGDRLHEDAPNEIEHFIHVVHHTCVEKRGKLIIPAFSVGRTQEVVHMLDRLFQAQKLPRVPVYIDSPLAINATEVFASHPECFDDDLHRYMIDDPNPFGFNDLIYVRSSEESKALNDRSEPCIIIASSGMMNAGRIRHHLINNVDNQRNTFLIVGYCSPGTPGAQLRDGAREISLFGKTKPVLADVETMDSFSAHGDQREMLDVIKNQVGHAKTVCLVHGTEERMAVWRDFLVGQGFADVRIPALGEEIIF
jgi:metallo-beta-lactamase family protein